MEWSYLFYLSSNQIYRPMVLTVTVTSVIAANITRAFQDEQQDASEQGTNPMMVDVSAPEI